MRRWAGVLEEGKFLRVILLEDGETVHIMLFSIDPLRRVGIGISIRVAAIIVLIPDA
jgi:hypothetical protein